VFFDDGLHEVPDLFLHVLDGAGGTFTCVLMVSLRNVWNF
jgi:hypothetical protein